MVIIITAIIAIIAIVISKAFSWYIILFQRPPIFCSWLSFVVVIGRLRAYEPINLTAFLSYRQALVVERGIKQFYFRVFIYLFTLRFFKMFYSTLVASKLYRFLSFVIC